MGKSVLRVNVFFGSMNYDSIEESPVLSTDGFISLIGGNFGLFWGASFLSIGELIILFLNYLYSLLIKAKVDIVENQKN
jgi:hypothetical protein